MDLYISGSNRKENCYKIANDLKSENDKFISLAEKNINYCIGCSACTKGLEQYCAIKDDMQEIYYDMAKAEKIIIITPVYMNHITGILKNVIDRWNPYEAHPELLKDKKIYIITVGQMNEEENEDIANNIKEYFESLGEFMEFETVFLRYLSSGDIGTIDDVTKNYKNYNQIIEEIKGKIKE